ncbi:FAD-binding protein [Eggerthellaceae bacterium 3-80]
MHQITCDVVVVGSGLSGTTAALSAAEDGADVVLVSLGPLFSGSSFYPGTWGLGCVGPENTDDEDEFISTILEVGQNVPDPKLVSTLVHETPLALAALEQKGVKLTCPKHADEQEFIPCFDHKHRMWRGIQRKPYEQTISRLLHQSNVTIHSGLEAIELLVHPHCDLDSTPGLTSAPEKATTVCGVVCFDHNEDSPTAGQLIQINAGSVVLATGGSGGLFARRLTGYDVIGSAQGMATSVGASLTNIEFIQIMPGLIGAGEGTVFNEKIFRHVTLTNLQNNPVLPAQDTHKILEARSEHGPFTCERISREVDFALARAGDKGLLVRYAPKAAATTNSCAKSADINTTNELPEFVDVYFTWLYEHAGITINDTMRIAAYAHAANGGIAIDSDGFCGVDGLYACGECSGGVHGADRIGGLASASALVFGRRAGYAAAKHALHIGENRLRSHKENLSATTTYNTFEGIDAQTAALLTSHMQKTMSKNCLILRSSQSLDQAARELSLCLDTLNANATPTNEAVAYARAMRLRHQINHAQAIVAAATRRTHSLGAHCYTE